MQVKRVAVIGAGWAGATAARVLHDHGCQVEVFEASTVIGGLARVERLRGVIYEPNGPHVFHTAHVRAAKFVNRFGMFRHYLHQPISRIEIDGESRYLSWPLQTLELQQQLPQWPRIRRELEARPPTVGGDNFEACCISLMGETLYRLFVYHYARKRWGEEPSNLSASLLSQRIKPRTDGRRSLHDDPWVYFPADGVNSVIESILHGIPVSFNTTVRLDDLCDAPYGDFDHIICTAPLDQFSDQVGSLNWRGIEMRARYYETAGLDGTVTRAYTINQPERDVPYTRTVETKHASGQVILGTVVGEEHPVDNVRHYPVLTVDQRCRKINELLKRKIREVSPVPVSFCGRLANYEDIDQDAAIIQGTRCALAILEP